MRWSGRNPRFARPLDPDLFHLICCLSQAGRVSDHDWEPTNIQRDLQDVPRRARYVGDDCSFAPSCSFLVSVHNGGIAEGCSAVPRKLRRLLLPTFGGPKIARRIPARMISPRRLSAKIDCILSLKRCARRLAVHVFDRQSMHKLPHVQRDHVTYLRQTHPPQYPRPLQNQ